MKKLTSTEIARNAANVRWGNTTPKRRKLHADMADKTLNKSLTKDQLSERNRANVLSRWTKWRQTNKKTKGKTGSKIT